MVKKTIKAAVGYECKGIILVGGVAANTVLRENLVALSPIPVSIPPIDLSKKNEESRNTLGQYTRSI